MNEKGDLVISQVHTAGETDAVVTITKVVPKQTLVLNSYYVYMPTYAAGTDFEIVIDMPIYSGEFMKDDTPGSTNLRLPVSGIITLEQCNRYINMSAQMSLVFPVYITNVAKQSYPKDLVVILYFSTEKS